MKKYTLFLFVFALFIILLGFNTNTASASNCASGDLFNTATGQACNTSTTPVECRSGDLFSSITGQPCGSTTPILVPSCPQFNLGTKGEAVKIFQAQLNAQGASLKVDGSYGPQTRAIAETYCKKPFPNPSSVVISGVSGPQTLNINEIGTWTVTASDKNGGNLNYSVVWGDEVYLTSIISSKKYSSSQQSATFTHSYAQAGIYKPVFTVRSENTIVCIQAPCPSNGGSAQTSLTVNVGDTTINPSITILSPNGGEAWVKGTTQTIKWQDNRPMPTCTSPINTTTGSVSTCIAQAPLYDVWLTSAGCSYPNPPCVIAPQEIVKNYSGTSYSWIVANEGSYKIMVCGAGSFSLCDSSDSYFKIISAPIAPSITVLSPNGGETWIKGTNQTIYWQSNKVAQYDVLLTPHSTSCDTPTNIACPISPSLTIAKNVYSSSSNFQGSYGWSVGTAWGQNIPVSDGSYTIQVCQSGTNICDSSDSYFKITSSVPATPSITLLSPNGGETLVAGQNYTIRWSASNFPSNATVYIELRPRSMSGNNNPIVKIAAVSPTSGSYVWQVPQNMVPDLYMIEVYQGDQNGVIDPNGVAKDISDASFYIVAGTTCSAGGFDSATGFRCGCTSISGFSSVDGSSCGTNPSIPSITVLSPNGGEQWQTGKTYPITWKSQNSYNKVGNKVRISLRNSSSGANTLLATVDSPDNLVNTYNLTIPISTPMMLPVGNYFVHIEYTDITECPSGVTCHNDDSDAPFSIVAGTAFSCDTLQLSSSSASYFGMCRNQGFDKVCFNKNTSEYQGCGRSASSNDCTVNNINASQNIWCDTGVITQPSITVLSPNGGEVWQKGTTNYPVTWKWTNIINTFNMYLINSNTGERVAMVGKGVSSEEANRTVVGIADVPVNAYIIPGSYKLQICDASNDGSVCDSSNAPFSIVAGTNPVATIDSVNFDRTTVMDAGGTANLVVSGSATGAVSAEYTFTDTYYDGHTSSTEIKKINFGNKDGSVFSWRYSTATLDKEKKQSVLRVSKVIVGNIEKSVSSAVITITDSSPNVLGAESFKFTQFLEEGSYGNEVRELQKFLSGAGYDAGNTDGIFGTKVKEAVMKLQTDNNLKVDGIVGFEVRSFLNNK